MLYADFFERVQDCDKFDRKLYSQSIRSKTNNKKDLNLFRDCFSNHTDFVAPSTNSLYFDESSSKRYIQKDNLSAYFVNEIYEPPCLFDYDTDDAVEYPEFISEFAESSFYKNQDSRFSLGSNRIRYLVGDVGQGKSAFMKKVFCDLDLQQDQIDPHHKVVSVYVDLERKFHYSETPVPLKDEFEVYIYERIVERLEDKNLAVDMSELSKINPHKDPLLSIKLLIAKSKEQGIRFLLYIDNLDFYHYYYARYSFFELGNRQQDLSIHENIMWLRSLLISPELLGHLGLNILISARSYVYEEIVSHTMGVETEVDTTQAVCLANTPESKVVGSRLQLLSKAVDIVVSNRPGASNSLQSLLSAFKLKLHGENIESEKGGSSPINMVYKLGQHGHRSLVHFLSSLNLSHSDNELIERFFDRQVSSLYILYFNNMFQRYSQEKDHFPNMFLVDCLVMDGRRLPEAHQPHMHTYWLKYFLMKYIYVHRERGVKFEEIRHVFCEIGGYEDHLVRHVLGSLCTANEFRCAEVDCSQLGRPFNGRKIHPTDRGKMLYREIEGVELCFEFEYFGTVLDDKWLSFPRPFFNHVCHPNSGYSHLYEQGNQYVTSSLASVRLKAVESINFLRILKAAYNVEYGMVRNDLNSILDELNLIPNFSMISDQFIYSTKGLLSAFSRGGDSKEVDDLRRLAKQLDTDKSYESFFEGYYESGVKVSL